MSTWPETMYRSAHACRSLCCAALAGLIAVAPVAAQPAPDPGGLTRTALRDLSRALEDAVRRALGPSPRASFGAPAPPRGYRLSGQGAFVVLSPVPLPQGHAVMVLHGSSAEPSDLDDLTRQVEEMEREAERARREAQQAFERVRRQIRVRLGEEGDPLPQPPPSAAAPPPWSFWFRIEPPREVADPAQVLGQVREALAAALVAHGPGLAGLEHDEYLSVAIDFVAGGLFGFGPSSSRTLVARVRGGDLAQRRAGSLSVEQLRERIAFDEY